ncbi:MAG: XdhC family protein [Proteobacteria bacterium]|jgi:xanthine dehydrogenase accessory factor|nr:XdhC family protein [Alphaproteobacteria bacterium]MDA0916417.1 XdhC family protein [Pseudomonadota bacterium]
MSEIDDILTPMSVWLKENRKVSLATVISTWGSSPRPVGGQMAIDSNGEIIGSVSGGCIEGAVITEGINSINDGKTRVKDYGISNNMAWEVGLACGGELKVLIQPLDIQDKIVFSIVDNIKNREAVKLRIDCSNGLRIIDNTLTNQTSLYDKEKNEFIHVIDPKPRLFVVGAVHIAQALISLAAITDFEIILIDPREHFATEKRFPNCKILTEWPDIALSRFNLDKSTHLVTLTHDPKIDDPALIYSLKKNIGYIGSLGSKKTHQKRCERLTSLGFSDNDINKIHAPIGLDIKGKTPAEIAVSIIAEIISFRRKSHDSN